MFKHVNKNMGAFLCQEWGDFFLYKYKVLICGDREGLGRDTHGFLRGGFARVSLVTGVSQLRWDKLLFIERHFFCLDLLALSSLITEHLKSGLALLEGMHQGKWKRRRLAYWCQDWNRYYFTSAHLTMGCRHWPSRWQTPPFLAITEKVTGCSRGGCNQSHK